MLVLCICLTFGLVFGANPDWIKKPYITNGFLYLNYGQIVEPFKAWVDNSTQRSRFDYYNGLNTFIFDEGLGYKILPHVNVDGGFTCFNVTGSLGFQHILPNISSYQMVNNKQLCEFKGTFINCTRYRSVVKYGNKVNYYDMFVRDNDIPIRYNFTGYNYMMDSHYDHYIFEYLDYEEGEIPQSVFDISPRTNCVAYPSSEVSHSELYPMTEFSMGKQDYEDNEKDTTLEFEMFKMKYSKKYNSDVEHEKRKSHFRQARRYIHSKNRQNLAYKLAINHLSDRSETELKLKNGYRYSGIGESHRLKSNEIILNSNIPDSLNWTAKGAVNLPKDQGTCGAGWSFATTGTLEGSYFLKHDKLLYLSEQCFIDCTWYQGNHGCDGGEAERVGEWLMIPGMFEPSYVTYQSKDILNYGYYMADDYCFWPGSDQIDSVWIKNYTVLPSGNLTVLRQMLVNVGPILVSIDASHPSFSFYSSGIYYEENCTNTTVKLDHSVLLVGYGTENGQDYWLIKNSWSAYWGDYGYIKMSTKNNNCGVATNALFFTLAK